MHLVPRELDKLVISQTGLLAQRRLARGVRLNTTEATALISHVLQELIRDGTHTVSSLAAHGKTLLGRRHVLPDVPHRLREIHVEGTFRNGSYLVTVHDPVCTQHGDLARALYASFLPVPEDEVFNADVDGVDVPGEVRVAQAGVVKINAGRPRRRVVVTNTGDRPVQVGSHYHFIEVNPMLLFDRIQAWGYRLDVPAGTAVRFEPGDSKSVVLVEIGGAKIVSGGNGNGSGVADWSMMVEVLQRLRDGGFAHVQQPMEEVEEKLWRTMEREAYAAMFGPTTGDLIRLGDTDLWVEVEKDYTTYGDECSFGGGKTLREGMGQASGRADSECLDLVITNAVVVDWSGIFKADIGVKDGIIVGIGKAGNPDVMDGVTEGMVVGSNTDVIAGEKKIVTYGGFDSHIHFICPQQAQESLSSGITTLLGGGTGPSTGTNATTCTPSAHYIRQMLQSVDSLPLNIGITGKGNDSSPVGLISQVTAGVVGLKLHEDWGTTPTAIDTCLSVCDTHDIQCLIHTDTLNESGFVEQTLAAFKGRTIHTYHTEGAGGGHAPDIISVVEHPNVLPSSTNPTRPFTHNTLDEHLDMLMVCHHLSRSIAEDVSFAESRIRAETIAAEDVLHDLGAISMMSSDSQAMGRCGEVISRTWRTAHKNRVQRGPLPEDVGTGADNFRVRRYIAKYTINPAVAHGMAHLLGDVAPGKLADLVVWDPAAFAAKPEMVVKGGVVAWAAMGDANASIPTVQPVLGRSMFAGPQTCVAWVSEKSVREGVVQGYGLKKRVEPVKGCRGVGKRDMKLNDAMPKMRVDPETYVVEADGVVCAAEPSGELPLTQAYYLF